jgi:hypothetical protein
MDVRLPDGTIIRGVPDGTTREQLTAKLKANGYSFDEPKPDAKPSEGGGSGLVDTVTRAARFATPAGMVSALASPQGRADLANFAAGGVRGAGSIGATLLAPADMAQDALDGKGLSLESNRQRRKDMTGALESLGADPNSAPFQAGQVATEVGGTMGAGGAVGNALTRLAPAAVRSAPAFNALVNAIQSGGMTTGAKAAPGLAGQAANLGMRTAGAAINGGASAGLVNPEDAPTGALINGAIPVVSKVAGTVGHAIGSAVSNKAATGSAVNKIATAIGDEAVPQAIADVQTYYPKGAEGIPLSAAAITKNPKLAQLEQGSRLNSAPAWWEFDQKQGKAVFDNVLDATKEAGDLGARKAARAENWQEAWSKAAESQKPRIWRQRMGQLGTDLDQALASPEASNPAVRNVIEAIRDEVVRVGPTFSPAHLQQLRANLNGKGNAMSPDVFKSAPRDSHAIKSLISEMDDILNASTGGKWQKVLEGYAKDSDAVRASAAASKVRGAFVDGETGRVVGTALNADGDAARVTEAGLSRAMNAARLPDKSLALSPESNNRLEATLEALRRQGMVQSLKKSATAGGGSDTIPNAIAAEAVHQAGAPNMLLQVLGAMRKLGVGKTENQMARLLANPDELAAELGRYMQPPKTNPLAAAAVRATPALTADR